jgi:hypothetical protein
MLILFNAGRSFRRALGLTKRISVPLSTFCAKDRDNWRCILQQASKTYDDRQAVQLERGSFLCPRGLCNGNLVVIASKLVRPIDSRSIEGIPIPPQLEGRNQYSQEEQAIPPPLTSGSK